MTSPAQYERPDTLADALAIRSETGARVIAGCTDVLPATEAKVVPGPVLDITGLAELRGLKAASDGLVIGATTTWADIVRADLPAALHALQLAAREVGAKQIQNRGTIAGNLCNASPAADGVPPLLVVDAEVALTSLRGTRVLPLSAFIQGPRRTVLAADEIVTAVHIPNSALTGQSHFLKLGARDYLVISIAMVAVRLDVMDGRIAQAACAIGSCGPVATRLPDVEAALAGQPVSDAASIVGRADLSSVLAPIDDIRADADYRKTSAAELLKRCAEGALTPERAVA